MPLTKIHVLEGRYNEARLGKVSNAVQHGLISALGIPPEDFFQIIHVLPPSQFLHARLDRSRVFRCFEWFSSGVDRSSVRVDEGHAGWAAVDVEGDQLPRVAGQAAVKMIAEQVGDLPALDLG